MVTHYLVDDRQSLLAANIDDGEIWSSSTGLPYLSDRPVRPVEALINQDRYDSIGRSVLNIMPSVESILESATDERDEFKGLGTALESQFYYSLLCFSYKCAVYDAWLKNNTGQACRVVGHPNLRPVNGLSPQAGRHDHMFAALARAMGDEELLLAVAPVDGKAFAASFHHVPRFDKLFNILNRPLGALLYQAWRRCGAPVLPGGKGILRVPVMSDAIEEHFPSLVFKGWRVVPVAVPNAPAEDEAPSDVPPDIQGQLKEIWASLRPEGATAAVFEAGWNLLWPRMAAAIGHYPPIKAAIDGDIASWSTQQSSRPQAVLSSGLYSPAQRILDSACRTHNIPVICLDHGASKGLGARHDFTAKSAISFSDIYLAYNHQTKRLYDGYKRSAAQTVIAAGAPAIVRRARFPGVQRRFGRRYLGISMSEPLLIYVTSLTANNAPQGYGTATDLAYGAFQKKLIDCLASFPGRVVVKPYPAHRYADPEQIWQMPLPSNVVRAPFGEFRHIRWAADGFILDLCSSTLGWALAPDKPTIYVDNISNPLTARAREEASDAMFLIDALAPDWQSDLRSLLSQPWQTMANQWQDKAKARRRFNAEYVLGPEDKLGASIIDALSASKIAARRDSKETVRERDLMTQNLRKL